MLYPSLKQTFVFICASGLLLGCLQAEAKWNEKGSYEFSGWKGPSLGVFYSIPPAANPDTPILVLIPGAKRNADFYRDAWHDLAMANRFIVLTLQARETDFPSEYDYNAGGVIDENGVLQPEEQWLFSAIELIFDDFRNSFESSRAKYSLYGHSAGGGFVHRFMLMKPSARVERSVAANPAFVSLPKFDTHYPFGLGGTELTNKDLETWFGKQLVILLGDLDRGPRTKPLSNGALARKQGPSVLARGLRLFQEALSVGEEISAEVNWKIEIVQNVGHSNNHMASYAVKHLFSE